MSAILAVIKGLVCFVIGLAAAAVIVGGVFFGILLASVLIPIVLVFGLGYAIYEVNRS